MYAKFPFHIVYFCCLTGIMMMTMETVSCAQNVATMNKMLWKMSVKKNWEPAQT